MKPERTDPSSDPHQVPFNCAPAIHQSAHRDEESPLVLSSGHSVRAIRAAPLVLDGVGDLEVEPLAFGCNTVELGEQLLLTHLIQVWHRP